MSVKQYLKDSGTVAGFVVKEMSTDHNGKFKFLKLLAYSPYIIPMIVIETFIDKHDRGVLLQHAKKMELATKTR